MLLKTLIYKGIETISVMYSQEEAKEMVLSYLEDVLAIKRHTHILYPDLQVQPEHESRILADFTRMASGEPFQYVVGKAHFYGREFRVTSSTLIPRQETELLCREVLTRVQNMAATRILDLCTGSGCIAWTLALGVPGVRVSAVDISEDALAVASAQNFFEEMSSTGALAPDFIRADILQPPVDFSRTYDVVVSNPPYVTNAQKTKMHKNVLEYEPHLALFVPDEDPLIFYRAVARWAAACLKVGGFLMVEINEELGQQTADVFSSAGFSDVNIVKDLSEKDRFVTARL